MFVLAMASMPLALSAHSFRVQVTVVLVRVGPQN